ncbi:hypothetical protein [Schlesneria sp. DSM 10557]|uniref:hypothetical protein n=1 Tax=Schlesneria sp. DSM 10557 TaxID=3044399 RepID=UPI00359F5ABD
MKKTLLFRALRSSGVRPEVVLLAMHNRRLPRASLCPLPLPAMGTWSLIAVKPGVVSTQKKITGRGQQLSNQKCPARGLF